MNHDYSELRVLKRDGRTLQAYKPEKVQTVILLAADDVGVKLADPLLSDIEERVTHHAVAEAADNVIGVEQIQDIVEKQLMAFGEYEVAKAYILFRAEKAKRRARARPVTGSDAEAIRRNRNYFKSDLQVYQMISKYARWLPEKGRRETWEEIVARVFRFLRRQVNEVVGRPGVLADDEWAELESAMLNLEALPSMRLVQMAGPAAERCNVGIYNCAYHAIDGPEAMAESLYVQMQGTGSSFSTEFEWVEDLPKVKRQKGGPRHKFVVQDSTEGWCNAYLFGLQRWFDGEDVEFDVSGVRAAGTVLKTKGGRASGPGPLLELLDFARARILSRQGRRLRTIDVHDIECMCGKIVQVGGVRRAARLGASSLADELLRDAKKGNFWEENVQRFMANNSAVYEEKPDARTFMREWLALADSGTGERGIWNLASLEKTVPARRRKFLGKLIRLLRPNPCGEINLLPFQFCNLSVAVIRPDDTFESIRRKVRLATLFGTIQSTMTDFKYVRPKWRENCEAERLLGVDLNGALDNKYLRFHRDPEAREARRTVLRNLRDGAVEWNAAYADRLGIPHSNAVTAIKPSGNSSVLLDTGNTITGRFSRYIIRAVRENSVSPVCQFLRDAGVPHHPEVGDDPVNPRVWVFEFPWESPEGATTKDELTAIEQLENWLDFKQCYTEHNPSATIYVGPDEWLAVGHWMYAHWDYVGGLSFLPRRDHVYKLAPFTAVTKEEFDAFKASFPAEIAWEKLGRYEAEDYTEGAQEFACTAGACAI